MSDRTFPPLVVNCHDGALAIPTGLYLRDWRGDPAEDMVLFRYPGSNLDWLGRLRWMRLPLPGEVRAASRLEAANA